MKIVVRIIIVLSVLTVLIIVGAFSLLYYFNQPPGEISPETYLFTVEDGDTLSSIAGNLKENDLIRSSLLLKIWSRIMGTAGDLKKGLYRIEPDFTIIEIHDLIISGKQQLYSITIAPGWTIPKIAEEFENSGITDSAVFITLCQSGEFIRSIGFSETIESLEGFIFPDTYLFPLDYPAEKVILHIINNFLGFLEEIYPDHRKLSDEDLYDKVILASIIEREYRAEDEAATIASVFYNRLAINMPLQSCATVVYVITEIQNKPHPDNLLFRDLEINSPFNTYLHTGLPPAPISNPGKTALSAVFFPEATEYLFFLVKDPSEGRHYFSKNFFEHSAAHKIYLKNN